MKSNDTIYIYGLIDPRTDAIRYVGKTARLKERLYEHQNGVKKMGHCGDWIQQLLEMNLKPEWTILEEVGPNENWGEREKFWIAYGRKLGWSLTNITAGGTGGMLGCRLTAEHRAKISAGNLGHPVTPETRMKLSIANRGRIPSAATLKKISRALKGRKFSRDHRRKIGEANRHRIWTPESRAKASVSAKKRGFLPTPKWGEKNGSSKLTVEKVREIRSRHATGNISYRQLADECGVHKETIYRAVRGITWGHVE